MAMVFVSTAIPEDILAPLVDLVDLDVWEDEGPVPREILLRRVSPCVGWLSMLTDLVDADLLDSAPELRVISQMSVGLDNVDLASCQARGVVVGHTPDVLTDATADTAFALIAAAVRRIPEAAARVKAGEWGPWDPWGFLSADLHHSRIGIVGMGRIGRAIARRARGFEMDVVYTSRTPKDVPDAEFVPLDRLLESCDVVVLAAPLDQQTRGMIGVDQLRRMKPSAYLVNIARGPLVDTAALVTALSKGWIAGAALDVTDPEPLPVDHPLLDLPNCLVVPHIGSATVGARRAMAELAVANLVAFFEHRPLPGPAPLPGG